MRKIAVVILHYEAIADTRECIDSLLKYYVDLIVVDNGSKNRPIDMILDIYKYYCHIHFIRSEINLGFARGNNIGYRYAKYELGADIIILANNDLVFDQVDFMEKCTERDRIGVAGPRIISLVDGKNQNPVCRQYNSLLDVKKRKWKYVILCFLCFFNLDKIGRKLFAKPVEEVHLKENEDFQLHGACIILGEDFINKYEGLYEGTFMYGEENILRYICYRDAIRYEYFDDIEVKHKEESSTKASFGKGIRKRLFFYRNSLQSCNALIKIMCMK